MKLVTTASQPNQLAAEKPKVGIYISPLDRSSLPLLQSLLSPYFSQFNFALNPENPATCKYNIVSDPVRLQQMIGNRSASLNDFQGSIVRGNTLILNPLEHIRTMEYGEFLFRRFIKKLLEPETFYHAGQFTWELLDPTKDYAKCEAAISFIDSCKLVAMDIETPGKDLKFSCISFAGFNTTTKVTKTYVIEFNSMASHSLIRRLAISPGIKILQNGQYDLSHLLVWNIVPFNYKLDTLGLFHAWFAELPRRLSFITAFTLRDVEYWKDEASGDHYEFLRYNARDAFGTLHACIAILSEMPEYAYKNYSISFPLVFPLLLCGLRGLAVDRDKLEQLEVESREVIEESRKSLAIQTGVANFNPGSFKQVLQLFHILGGKGLESTDAKGTAKFAAIHPLNSRIAASITKYREAKKFHSNYATVRLLHGRLHYSLNPWGTESARLSSSGSHFNFNENYGTGKVPSYINYGFQIQNVPEEAKVFIIADDDFVIVELDGSQAESRTTGYLSQDLTLIDAVEKSPDFHSFNASKFFGISFEDLWDVVAEKTKNKPIRDLAKRVNHGANYNMAYGVLIETMGEANMWKAKSLLGLPKHYGLKDIAQHLLIAFCNTYPRLKGTKYVTAKNHADGVKWLISEDTYYGEIIQEVLATGLLQSPLDWTRRCFANPMLSKPALNKYVAHPSQNLSVHIVNRALLRVYSDATLRDESVFKLCAQVHDSLLCQIKKSMVDKLLPHIESLMQEKVIVHGRILSIPFVGDKPKSSWK